MQTLSFAGIDVTRKLQFTAPQLALEIPFQ
jgi:hypothetical protein